MMLFEGDHHGIRLGPRLFHIMCIMLFEVYLDNVWVTAGSQNRHFSQHALMRIDVWDYGLHNFDSNGVSSFV
jgi:hypothetical protein